MAEYPETRGKTTIDPGVLINIAKLAALSVDGVSRMSPGPHSIESIFKSSYSGGVNITVENNTVDVDLYLVLKNDTDLFKTSEKVQNKVARAITEMVGMEIGRVNVHIEDIDYHAE
jgi:uncharacterized alkaline shock family protein YloU